MIVPKPLRWLGSTRKDLSAMPEPVKESFGYGLYLAQIGARHPAAKVLRGFHGAAVIELLEDESGDSYRAVYTIRYPHAVYVLHCFKKKSVSGISTPMKDIELIKKRLKEAAQLEKDQL